MRLACLFKDTTSIQEGTHLFRVGSENLGNHGIGGVSY